MKSSAVVLLVVLATGIVFAQPSTSNVEPLHRPFDEILDLYVRDGLVYYLALRNERARFDRYVDALGVLDQRL